MKSNCSNSESSFTSETSDSLHFLLKPLNKHVQGVQGQVYTCVLKKNNVPIETVGKISNNIDFVLELEKEIWNRLSVFKSLHFCEVIDIIPIKKGLKHYCIFYTNVKVHKNAGKQYDNSNILFTELTSNKNVREHHTFSSFIENKDLHPSAILNCTKQTLLAVSMYETLGITHYDLHTSNIMISSTKYDIHVYHIGTYFTSIFTFGVTPVIIDFGTAHVPNYSWAATSAFTKNGITTFTNDTIIDNIFFLCSVARELKINSKWIKNNLKKETKNCLHFVQNVKLMFRKLNIQSNGWFKTNFLPDIIDELMVNLPKIEKGILNYGNLQWILELLQFSIIVPITNKKENVPSFQKALLTFAIIWTKTVNPIIRNTKEEEFFFKDIILNLVQERNCLHCQNAKNKVCPNLIYLKHRYPTILNIYRIRDAVQTLSDAMHNEIFSKIPRMMKTKTKSYQDVILQNTIDIAKTIPIIEYKYKSNMTVLVQSIQNGIPTQKTFTLTKTMAHQLNNNTISFQTLVNSIN